MRYLPDARDAVPLPIRCKVFRKASLVTRRRVRHINYSSFTQIENYFYDFSDDFERLTKFIIHLFSMHLFGFIIQYLLKDNGLPVAYEATVTALD